MNPNRDCCSSRPRLIRSEIQKIEYLSNGGRIETFEQTNYEYNGQYHALQSTETHIDDEILLPFF